MLNRVTTAVIEGTADQNVALDISRSPRCDARLRLGGDIFRSDAVTVHQRPERPDLVRPRKSHLPFEQLVERSR